MSPRFSSFFYHSAGAVFLGIFFTSLVLVAISWNLVGKPMVQTATRNFARQVQSAADEYRRLPPAARPGYIERLHRDLGLRIEPEAQPARPGERPHLPYFVHLEAALSSVAGAPVTVMRHGATYFFDFPPGGGGLRFGIDRSGLGTAPGRAIVAMLLFALLASLAAALFIARIMARPLETMAQRTRSSWQRDDPPLPEEGVRELRDIARHFNHVTSQHRELLSNHAVMLAGISHDLRAPITRARMALELARADMQPSLAERIERALLQMDALIGQYLDFTRGCVKEVAAPVRIERLLREIVQTYKDADIELDVPPGVISLPSRAFARCVQNLLDNAVKHGAGAAIAVRFGKTGSEWTLDIADRGPGIPETQIERVFQPFLRLDEARTQPGNGLGLSIVQEICQVQGWLVSLRARPAGGLIARLTLPAGSPA